MKVAIIGGIGSGKSLVLQILKNLGAKVYSADDINRELLTSSDYVNKLAEIFPDCISANGSIDKKKIREIIQTDENKKLDLETLSHPIIMTKIVNLGINEKLSFVEISVPSSVEMMSIFDNVIVVYASYLTRIKRIMHRDKVGFKQAVQSISIQKCYKNIKANYVISNNKNIHKLTTKVEEIYSKLNAQVK